MRMDTTLKALANSVYKLLWQYYNSNLYLVSSSSGIWGFVWNKVQSGGGFVTMKDSVRSHFNGIMSPWGDFSGRRFYRRTPLLRGSIVGVLGFVATKLQRMHSRRRAVWKAAHFVAVHAQRKPQRNGFLLKLLRPSDLRRRVQHRCYTGGKELSYRGRPCHPTMGKSSRNSCHQFSITELFS